MRRIAISIFFLVGCGGGAKGPSGVQVGHDLAQQQGPYDLGGDLANTIVNDAATSGSDQSSMHGPMVGLTFNGCSPDFSGTLIAVAGNGSMVVASQSAPASGEVQLHLTETSGTITLSSMERVQTGDVVNVIAGTTWTNAQSSMGSDPISGTITINSYDEAAAQANLTFTAVMLQNVEDHSICQVDGTLVSTGSSF